MSYNRQPVAEDPMQIWGAVGVLLILLLFVIWLFLPGSGLRQLPDSSYLMGTGRLGAIS